jgi:hypothetical protein
MATLKKLSTSFAKTQMWKQYNKLRDCFTVNMDEEKLERYREALRFIERDLQFITWNAIEVQNKDDE